MDFQSTSDLARSLLLRRQNAELQSKLTRLTGELSTGRVSDIGRAARGEFNPLATIDRSLALNDSFTSVQRDFDRRLVTLQSTFDATRDVVSGIASRLLSATNLQNDTTVDPIIAGTGDRFRAVVGFLNQGEGDRFLLAGTASDQVPLIDPNVMLDDIRLAAAGATDAADLRARVDDWFNNPAGGFFTTAYQGGAANSGQVAIGANQSVQIEMTAADEEFRDMMRDLALVTLVDEGAFVSVPDDRREVLRSASENLMAAEAKIVNKQAELGEAQNRVESVRALQEAERYALNEARENLIGVDEFETATVLEEVRTQLETLFLLTARTSRLSLTEYLR